MEWPRIQFWTFTSLILHICACKENHSKFPLRKPDLNCNDESPKTPTDRSHDAQKDGKKNLDRDV